MVTLFLYKYIMELVEALETLKSADLIAESLTANRRKFYVMIDKLLEPFETDSYYYEEPNDAMGEDAIVLKRSILKKISKEQLQHIVDVCGYQMSVHAPKNGNDIWITPVNGDELHDDNFVYEDGYRILFHVSPVKDLDKKGIRCKSRPTDKEFDVYHGRIYCMMTDDDVDHARSMVTAEHNKHKAHLYTYKIKVPKGYEIYPDPTTPDGVYLTNNIPPQFIERIDDFDNDIDHYIENEEKRRHDIAAQAAKINNLDGIKL